MSRALFVGLVSALLSATTLMTTVLASTSASRGYSGGSSSSTTYTSNSNYDSSYSSDGSGSSWSGSSSSSSSDAYGVNFFAESTNTQYDGYQQAWRYLGWYVDCGNPSGRYNERGSHASHDNQKTYGNMYCQRYLMWAAVRRFIMRYDSVSVPAAGTIIPHTHVSPKKTVRRSQLFGGRDR
jgi:hypothetical protein